jgi:hypothetical protein
LSKLDKERDTVEESTGSEKDSLRNHTEIDEEEHTHADTYKIEAQDSHSTWHLCDEDILIGQCLLEVK